MSSISASTSPQTLCRYITEPPTEATSGHLAKSILYLTAAAVGAVAALAIFGGITAIYLGLLASTPLSGWGILGTLIAACSLMQGVNVFSEWHVQENFALEWNQEAASNLAKIEHWGPAGVRQFLIEHQMSSARIPAPVMALLEQQSPNLALNALLPLIALYQTALHRMHLHRTKENEQAAAIANIERNPRSSANDALLQWLQQIKEEHARKAVSYTAGAVLFLDCIFDPTIKGVPTIYSPDRFSNALSQRINPPNHQINWGVYIERDRARYTALV